MKKLFLALVVCAGFCACSNDDVVVTSNPGDYSREAAAYLTVNIKDVNSGTRASDGGFAYGTADEQTVNNAYFYFYDAEGNYMANGAVTGVSGTANTADPVANVEWNSNTLVAVYGLEAPTTENPLPTQMLTVLNKPTSVNLERQSLTDAIATLAGTPYGDTTNGFVMSTSVYMSGNALIYTTALTADNFAIEPINLAGDYKSYTEDGTTKDGNADGSTVVNVYVERLAAKVGVNCSMTSLYRNTYIYAASETLLGNFAVALPTPQGTSSYAIQLEGFDVDGVARDAYLVKQIDADWSLGTWEWNASSNFRSYWAMSPNYGDTETVYPTSSNGNTATEEANASTWLNNYLRYVDLKDPVAIGSTTYCGENTNTVGEEGVIDAIDNNGLTNVIVKAKFGEYDPNYGTVTGIDLVEYHGEYYTADDFLDKCVYDVMNYDFTVVVDEIVEGLETSYPELTEYLDEINNAIIKDAVYVTKAVTDHKVTQTLFNGVSSSLAKFDGSMLSLYNIQDGYVDLFFNGAEQYYGENGNGTQVEPTLCGKYPAEDIVYGGAKMSDYEFYFHVDYSALSSATQVGAALFSLIVNDGAGNYYLPIDNSFCFETQNSFTDDKTWNGDHIYTLRNYFLRAITVEADGIDTQFGKHYPNYFAGGEMYYHVPIEHLNNSNNDDLLEGQYGVVRNHWYDITITSLEGLGRGIADKDEVIVPLPEVEYYYLGADINILSWKMVNQTVGF